MRTLLLLFFMAASLCVPAQEFRSMHITPDVYARISGKSLPAGARIDTSSLRYLSVAHYDLKGNVRQGEMIVSEALAAEVLDIFRELFAARYPIETMRLIDDFGADDNRSMAANNTSCFCYRTTPGSRTLSNHAKGRAIDINPLYNPYVKGTKVLPPSARPYTDRSKPFPFKIDSSDLAYHIFTRHGWKWGGNYRTLKDYQHFEK